MSKGFFLLLTLICTLSTYGQDCFDLSYLNREVDTLLVLPNNSANSSFPVFNFFSAKDSVHRIEPGGMLPLDRIYKGSDNEFSDFKNLAFHFQPYTQSTSALKIIFHGIANDTVSVTFQRDGYHEPMVVALSERLNLPFTAYQKIEFLPVAKGPDSRVLVKDGFLGAVKIDRVAHWPSRLCTQKKELSHYSQFDSYGIYETFPIEEREEEYKGELFASNDTLVTPFEKVSGVVRRLLLAYPYYQERSLDKDKVLQRYHEKLEELKGEDENCIKFKGLDEFLVDELQDPHFRVKWNPCEPRDNKRSPIFLYKLDEDFLVAANFDKDLQDKLPLGSKILRINDSPVSRFKDAASVNSILKAIVGSNLEVELVSPSSQDSITRVGYVIKERYDIPDNFRPSNLKTKKMERGNVVYLKINRIDFQLPLKLINEIKTFNEAKKIILDLRGCGGGDLLAGANFTSHFVNGSFSWYFFKSRFSEFQTEIVAAPNKSDSYISYEIPLRILVDERTACAAELLTAALRKHRSDVKVIGTQSTQGALTLAQNINFQDIGVTVRTNALGTGKILTPEGESIEGKGISPDLQVAIESIEDLQPYRDKVLVQAINN